MFVASQYCSISLSTCFGTEIFLHKLAFNLQTTLSSNPKISRTVNPTFYQTDILSSRIPQQFGADHCLTTRMDENTLL